MNNNISPELFGEKLKTLRKNAKYTQETFSELIGIEPQNLSRIERGLNFPSLATFIKIASVLNMEPNDLLDVEYLCDENKITSDIQSKIEYFNLNQKRILHRILKVIAEYKNV